MKVWLNLVADNTEVFLRNCFIGTPCSRRKLT